MLIGGHQRLTRAKPRHSPFPNAILFNVLIIGSGGGMYWWMRCCAGVNLRNRNYLRPRAGPKRRRRGPSQDSALAKHQQQNDKPRALGEQAQVQQ